MDTIAKIIAEIILSSKWNDDLFSFKTLLKNEIIENNFFCTTDKNICANLMNILKENKTTDEGISISIKVMDTDITPYILTGEKCNKSFFKNDILDTYLLTEINNLFIAEDKYFLKILPIFSNINHRFTQINDISRRSLYYSNYINDVIKASNSPNLVASIIIKECKKNIETSGFDALFYDKIKSQDMDLSQLNIIFSEMVNGISLYSFIPHLLKLDINEINNILFQIIYTIELLRIAGIQHNDLHTSNIMVTRLNKEMDFIYTTNNGIGKNLNFHSIKTKYLIKIIDYDRTYEIYHGVYDIFHKLKSIKIDENNLGKMDIYLLMRWLEKKIINIKENPENITGKNYLMQQINYVLHSNNNLLPASYLNISDKHLLDNVEFNRNFYISTISSSQYLQHLIKTMKTSIDITSYIFNGKTRIITFSNIDQSTLFDLIFKKRYINLNNILNIVATIPNRINQFRDIVFADSIIKKFIVDTLIDIDPKNKYEYHNLRITMDNLYNNKIQYLDDNEYKNEYYHYVSLLQNGLDDAKEKLYENVSRMSLKNMMSQHYVDIYNMINVYLREIHLLTGEIFKKISGLINKIKL